MLFFVLLTSGSTHADDVQQQIIALPEYPKVTNDPEGSLISLIDRFCQKGWQDNELTDLGIVWRDLNDDGLPDMIASPAARCTFKLIPEWEAYYPVPNSEGVESIIYFAVSTQEWRLGWRGRHMLLFPDDGGWFTRNSLNRYLDDQIDASDSVVNLWKYLSPTRQNATFQAVFTHHSPCLLSDLKARAPNEDSDWVTAQWRKFYLYPCFITYQWDGCTLQTLETNWPGQTDRLIPTCREE
ncbi:MAG: hypothetical protein AAF439_02060 [Pseudomonadota bacterium]